MSRARSAGTRHRGSRATGAQRAGREGTLAGAQRFIALPYDETVAELLTAGRDAAGRAGAMVLAELAPALRVAQG